MPTPKRHRDRIVSVRYYAEEWDRVLARAAECGLPPSRYVRERSLGESPRARPGAADRTLNRHLSRLGNNLNQIARRLNSYQPVAQTEILETAALIRSTLEQRLRR